MPTLGTEWDRVCDPPRADHDVSTVTPMSLMSPEQREFLSGKKYWRQGAAFLPLST
jgi:hypothetical protein